MKKRLVLAIIWLVLILFVTLTPGEQLPDTPDVIGFDKLVHFTMFLVLAFLWLGVDYGQSQGETNKSKFNTKYLVFGIVFAIFVEYAQQYIPGRSFDYGDMIANVTGWAIGAISFYILLRRQGNLV